MSNFLPVKSNSGFSIIVVIALIAFAVYLMTKNKGQYNAEQVSIQRDERGRIAGMTINRSAH